MNNSHQYTKDNLSEKDIFKPIVDGKFRFSCHKGIRCFTDCCAKLRLLLTPYDILRLKNRLEMSSDRFLEEYTDTDLTSHARFPMVRLKMKDDENRTCPFVTPEGCRIYEDRPGACRLYPVGRAARMTPGEEQKTGEKFFLVCEPHCFGFQEKKEWTQDEWLSHEGVQKYNTINDQWLRITGSNRSLGPKEAIQKKVQMFFMASYNLDKFRDFVMNSRFFDLFDLDPDLKNRIKEDDEALLLLAYDFLRFSLFGEKTMVHTST